MARYHFLASSISLLLAFGIGGCAPSDDMSATKAEESITILIPADLSNSLDGAIETQCLASAPDVDLLMRADCFVIAARRALDPSTCDPQEGLFPVSAEHRDTVDRLKATPEAKEHYWNTYCELAQLNPASAEGQACRTNTGPPSDGSSRPMAGFCYVDQSTLPPSDDYQLFDYCPGTEKRGIHFSHGTSASALSPENKSLTIVCSHEVYEDR